MRGSFEEGPGSSFSTPASETVPSFSVLTLSMVRSWGPSSFGLSGYPGGAGLLLRSSQSAWKRGEGMLEQVRQTSCAVVLACKLVSVDSLIHHDIIAWCRVGYVYPLNVVMALDARRIKWHG